MVKNNNSIMSDLKTPVNGHLPKSEHLLTDNAITVSDNLNQNHNNSNNNNNNCLDNNNSSNGSLSSSTLSWWDTFVDFIWFIMCSIGYILQDLYYLAFGYPEKDLTTDIALITGGGSGLGRLLAQRLGKIGTKVIIWDINKDGIKETIELVEEEGGYCKGYVVDISKKEDVYKSADVIRKEIGDVTLLINNAGVVSGLHLLDTPDYLIERSFNVNVMAHFWTTKAFLPKMIENDRGHIATIASLAGHVGITKLVDYCSSKFAAVGFDEALRLELEVLGHNNIQTTCICPFFIQATGMFDDVNARWVPTLNPNDVADRVVVAIKKNEKVAIIPGYIKALLSFKWTFPWGCVSGLLRRLVPDAAPHGFAPKLAFNKAHQQNGKCSNGISSNGSLSCSASSSNSGSTKTSTLLVQRTPSVGERVL